MSGGREERRRQGKGKRAVLEAGTCPCVQGTTGRQVWVAGAESSGLCVEREDQR